MGLVSEPYIKPKPQIRRKKERSHHSKESPPAWKNHVWKFPSRFLQKTQQIHARIFSTCTTRKKRQRKQFPWYCMKTYVSWSETVHDLWYSSKSTSYFRDLNNICHHSGWGHFRQKKKISSFFTFVASLKIALCSSVSHQRSPCFGCTSMGGLLNKHRASILYSIHPGRWNSQFPIMGPPQENGTERAKLPQGGKNPDSILRGFKQLWSISW